MEVEQTGGWGGGGGDILPRGQGQELRLAGTVEGPPEADFLLVRLGGMVGADLRQTQHPAGHLQLLASRGKEGCGGTRLADWRVWTTKKYQLLSIVFHKCICFRRGLINK